MVHSSPWRPWSPCSGEAAYLTGIKICSDLTNFSYPCLQRILIILPPSVGDECPEHTEPRHRRVQYMHRAFLHEGISCPCEVAKFILGQALARFKLYAFVVKVLINEFVWSVSGNRISPWSMMATRSHRHSASSIQWATMNTVLPFWRPDSTMSQMLHLAWRSRPLVGTSRKRI